QDALKIDPNMPEAFVGIARTLAVTDPEKAGAALERALAINPNFPDGHLLMAGQHIDSEQYDRAKEEIAKALAVNPQSTEAISLLASIDFLREPKDIDTFIKTNENVQKALKINPNYSRLFDTLADNCVSLRLYEQAVAFSRKALLVNARDWTAM